jgi:predicted metal-dependent phosphoesterase TrpH
VVKVDLHVHSTASDGRLSPADLVRKSAEAGLTVIALADHDTVDGIIPALEAAKAFPQLKVIPAVEISTYAPKGEVHVLGYFIDHTDPVFRTALRKMCSSREERAQAMITKLNKLGVHIKWERVSEIAGSGAVGRPHIAQAMLEKGYIASIKEAFTRYIGWGGPAYAERDKVTPTEALKLILRVNGLPVLAHPLTVSDLEELVTELKASGLVGIEAYSDSYAADEVSRLVHLAERHGLIITGGSDYHGIDTGTETMLGSANVPIEAAEQLMALAEQRALKPASQ